jgi:hypothetical protein
LNTFGLDLDVLALENNIDLEVPEGDQGYSGLFGDTQRRDLEKKIKDTLGGIRGGDGNDIAGDWDS